MTYTSPILSVHGAVEASGPDAGVAAHYGDPIKEQRRLERSTDGSPAAVDLSHRGVVSVTGDDRASWLTTLSSQVISGLPVGTSSELTLLSAQGRIEFQPHVIVGAEAIWLIVESGQQEALATFLDSMRFMLRVEVNDVTANYAVVGSTRSLAGRAGVPDDVAEWQDPWPAIGPGGTSYSAVEAHPGEEWEYWETLVPRTLLGELTVEWCGSWALEALRIAAWRPRYATEVDEKSIPHELDLMRTAVHLSKGCYKGQETIARVHNLGHPPRRLVFLDVDGSEHTLPEVGAEVFAPGGKRPAGRITSVALHHEAGPIALAVIKRGVDPEESLIIRDSTSHVEAGAETEGSVTVEYAAAQTVVVSPDAGQAVGRRNRGDFLK
ncbi:CAF17-like 4Fe-4S cluster assembly/insertion protein YgfZ [Kocuria sp. HSID16901]|uniref:CAF17-like 4Fe-4S cluster assembly/insertion protein YgfZ n=1 Tax=Kocuria sp. HSID16901 TaxID=2419505 RepID=UPI0006603353|nr:folate-binding protein YgfZ [Kocuria sp. HSID16901]RUQ23356.1 folate-binding protein [Kocuria sp. HSID16901]